MKKLAILADEDIEFVIIALEMSIEALEAAANETLYKKSVQRNSARIAMKFSQIVDWLVEQQ